MSIATLLMERKKCDDDLPSTSVCRREGSRSANTHTSRRHACTGTCSPAYVASWSDGGCCSLQMCRRRCFEAPYGKTTVTKSYFQSTQPNKHTIYYGPKKLFERRPMQQIPKEKIDISKFIIKI